METRQLSMKDRTCGGIVTSDGTLCHERCSSSVYGFASVADLQDHDLFPIVVIESDVGPLAKLNRPLAELGW